MSDNLTDALAHDVPLSQMISSLRQELRVAQQNAQEDDEGPFFGVEDVEVELSIKVTKQTKGGIKVYVVGEHSRGSEALHTFRLKLAPRGDIEVSASDPVRPK